MNTIKSLNICLTNRCNQNCIHCYVDPGKELNELSVQKLEILIQELIKKGLESVHVFGGEPFLYNDLDKLLTFLGKSQLQSSIVTNATILRENILEIIEKYNIFLGITVHGTKKKHEKITNNAGSYEKVINFIKYVVRKEIQFGIMTCVHKVNIDDYLTMVAELAVIGVNNFFILYFSPLGRGKINDLSLRNEKWLEFIRKVNDFRLSSGLSFFYEPSIIKKESSKHEKLFFYEAFNCNARDYSQIVIDTNGNIFPCILLLENNKYHLGSIQDEQLDLKKIIKKIPITCSSCELIDEGCRSGCLAYLNEDGIDFRCEKGKFLPLCPLVTYQLF
ncbi:MAG: radical SAM protein [Candidatus Lokiarchaeota archaeon]|nr:radical SAM protein [Candidatus Lokiarchaeota archaeon]